MKTKALVVLIALLAGLLTGCSAAFPNSEGGFLSYITGSTVTRDKEANRHEEAVQAERARKAEAETDKAHEDRLAAEAEAAEADANEGEAHWRALEAGENVDLEVVKGDNYLKRAVGRALDAQTAMHVGLQLVMVVFALFGFGVALGVGVAYLKERYAWQ